MGLISGIWLTVLGILGAANLIIARKPSAKELIGKLAPYQGWIGVVSAFWGLWGIISAVLSLGWLAYMPIYWATFMGASVLQAILGILLGIGTMKTFIKQPQAVEKLDALVTRMAPKQGVLGFIAIGTGIWMILAGFFFMSTAVGVVSDTADALAAQQAAMQAAIAGGQMTPEQAQALAQAQATAAAAIQGAAGQMTPEQAQAMAQAQAAAMQAAAGQMTPEQAQAMAQAQAAQAAAMQAAAGQMAAAAPSAPAAAGGTAATALIQQVWPAGTDSAQQPLTGIDLYVYPPNGTPYQVRLPGFPVPAAKQAMIVPQATINVSIDSANPMNVTPVL